MDVIQRGIVTLIRSAITGQALHLPEEFHMDEAEKLILSHQIVGLAYEGAVLCGISREEPAMCRLLQRYCQIMQRSRRQVVAVETLLQKLEAAGIDHLPVKGCELKKLYPNPSMRTMGDADILIRMEQYEAIRLIMQQLGYTEGIVADHAMGWDGDVLEIELHRRLVPKDETYYEYMGDGWQRALHAEGCRYTLSLEDMYVFLFAHLVKHYRRGGIGLRQVVDLWVYNRAFPEMNKSVLAKQLEDLSLTTFHENIIKLLEYWFEDGQEDTRTAFISQFIFDSGSWGTPQQHHIFAGYQKAQETGSAKTGRAAAIVQIIFPGKSEMANRYPVLNRAPWLLPVLWPVRWVTALLFRRENVKACRDKAAQNSVENIETFRQSLEYVGLR